MDRVKFKDIEHTILDQEFLKYKITKFPKDFVVRILFLAFSEYEKDLKNADVPYHASHSNLNHMILALSNCLRNVE